MTPARSKKAQQWSEDFGKIACKLTSCDSGIQLKSAVMVSGSFASCCMIKDRQQIWHAAQARGCIQKHSKHFRPEPCCSSAGEVSAAQEFAYAWLMLA